MGVLCRQGRNGHGTFRGTEGRCRPRWICEQTHQRLKEELGLDPFEGRSWQGLHRHAAAVRQAILELIARPPPQRCPRCRKWICSEKRLNKSAKVVLD